jgi:OmpR-family two-component system manganese-sensing response regulator
MPRILLADDDALLANMVRDALAEQGHTVEVTNTGADAAQILEAQMFDLLILDWNMPECTGVELCKRLRKQGKHDPILLLTGRSDIEDKEVGLDAGADDYLTKPFELRELIARVKSLLRRPASYVSNQQRLAEITIDFEAHTLTRHGQVAKLKPREFELLEFFLRRQGHLLSGELLLSSVWGADFDGSEIALRSCLAKLRKALASLGYPELIETVHGCGYRLKNPTEM